MLFGSILIFAARPLSTTFACPNSVNISNICCAIIKTKIRDNRNETIVVGFMPRGRELRPDVRKSNLLVTKLSGRSQSSHNRDRLARWMEFPIKWLRQCHRSPHRTMQGSHKRLGSRGGSHRTHPTVYRLNGASLATVLHR